MNLKSVKNVSFKWSKNNGLFMKTISIEKLNNKLQSFIQKCQYNPFKIIKLN